MGESQILAAILKDLTGSIFGCAPEQIRSAAFLIPNTKVTNFPWDNDKMCLGDDWFSGFLKINRHGTEKARFIEGKSTGTE